MGVGTKKESVKHENRSALEACSVVVRFAWRGVERTRARERVSAAGDVESWMGLGYLLRDSLDYVYLFVDFRTRICPNLADELRSILWWGC